ncbi:Cell surface glycoprotein 1 [Talaromyces islandicus]|uniref:Cell surface glycoprotein 1 n=1 Tax=Talaromyces islandicus TaxID=28573 RepID=A0A0U1M0N8_TALIS|nr:Cell surface glycoprotein 1 [Talaromyces islandicus]
MVNSKLTVLVFAGSALSAVVPREEPGAGHDYPAAPAVPVPAPWGPPGSVPSNTEHNFPGDSIGEHEHTESEYFPPPEVTMSAPLQAAFTGAPGAGPFPELRKPHGPKSASFNSISQTSSECTVPPFRSEPTQAPQREDSFHPVGTFVQATPALGSSHIRPPPCSSGESIRPLSTFTQTPRPCPSNGAPQQPSQGVPTGGLPSFDHPEPPFGSYGHPWSPPHPISTDPAKPGEETHLKYPSGDSEGPGPHQPSGGSSPPFHGGSSEPPHPSGPEGQPPHPGPDGPPGEPPHSPHPEGQPPHPEGQPPHFYSGTPPQTGTGEPHHPSVPEGNPPHPGPDGHPRETPHSPQPQGKPPHSYGGLPPPQASAGEPPHPGHDGPQEGPSGHPAGPTEQAGGSPPLPVGISEQHNPQPIGEPAGDHGDHPTPPHAMSEGESPCPEGHPVSPHNPHSTPPVLVLASFGKPEPTPRVPSRAKPGSRQFEKSRSSSAASPSRSPLPPKTSVTKQSSPQPTQKTTDTQGPEQSSAQFSSNAVMSKKTVSTGLMFALLTLAGSLTQATPVTRSAGFSSVCSDITLDSNFWLHATCPDDSGAPVDSTVYLPFWIENDQGKLAWKDDGNFEYYCSDYILFNNGTLGAYCQGTFTNQSGNSTLNLEEHIANYNGHLLSDLDGTPDTPKNSSTVPVPADPSLNITFSTSSTDCESGFAWPITSPEDCWAFTYATGRATPFDSVQIAANQGWSIEGYNASGCLGTPLWTYSASENQCVAFSNGSLAYFKMTPLWNWD